MDKEELEIMMNATIFWLFDADKNDLAPDGRTLDDMRKFCIDEMIEELKSKRG
jgi:hypothetical protein